MAHADFAPVFEAFEGRKSDLIPLLQSVQRERGYISQESVREIARFLRISENHIYGVASFYAQFKFRSPGKHRIRVCKGTACHVQGSQLLSQEIHDRLGLTSGEVTPDGKFDYQEVDCLGCCAQAAVVDINGKIFARMTTDKLTKRLKDYD
jgi:NADH-quinone oxidoreductase subunit E